MKCFIIIISLCCTKEECPHVHIEWPEMNRYAILLTPEMTQNKRIIKHTRMFLKGLCWLHYCPSTYTSLYIIITVLKRIQTQLS